MGKYRTCRDAPQTMVPLTDEGQRVELKAALAMSR